MKHKTHNILSAILFTILFFFSFSLVYASVLSPEYAGRGTAPVGSIADYANRIYQFSIVLGSILAVVMIVVGGFEYITAGGNESTVGRAKTRITQALLGILLILGSYLILNTINPDLVNFDLGLTPLEIKNQGSKTKASDGNIYSWANYSTQNNESCSDNNVLGTGWNPADDSLCIKHITGPQVGNECCFK